MHAENSVRSVSDWGQEANGKLYIPLTPNSWKQNGNSFIRFATVSLRSMIEGFLYEGVEGKEVMSQRKGRLWHLAFIKGKKESHLRKSVRS